MKYILLFIALIALPWAASAQTIKAITQHGETVVLFENGTWKYEKELTTESATSTPVVPAPAATVVATPMAKSFSVDTTKSLTSGKTEIFNAVSKKLARFFGEEKGRVRCSVSATNNKGEVSLNFEFMMPVGDANRYFGYTAFERNLRFMLSDGTAVNGTFTEKIEEKFIDKWNVSYYKASMILNNEDVTKLINNNAMRLIVDWKKTEEEYIIDHMDAIKNILIEVI